jgi:glutamyl-tRNA synthetase
LLGWSYDETSEIFGKQELIEKFSLERVGKTPAVFSMTKLEWMNGVYIRAMSVDELAERILPFVAQAGILDPADEEQVAYLRRITPLIHERLKRLAETPELVDFFFSRELTYDPRMLVDKKVSPEQALGTLVRSRQEIAALDDFSVEGLERLLRGLAEHLGLKASSLFGMLRVAITGRTVAPPLFQTMEVLGQPIVIERLDRAIRALAAVVI